jgi:hypothetical protein
MVPGADKLLDMRRLFVYAQYGRSVVELCGRAVRR